MIALALWCIDRTMIGDDSAGRHMYSHIRDDSSKAVEWSNVSSSCSTSKPNFTLPQRQTFFLSVNARCGSAALLHVGHMNVEKAE
jgi:hypothetical protein